MRRTNKDPDAGEGGIFVVADDRITEKKMSRDVKLENE
jgi:hypothetical protein